LPTICASTAVLLAVTADFLVGRVLPSANAIDFGSQYLPPWPLEFSTKAHLLGTDQLGRDFMSRLVLGTRVSIGVGLSVVMLAVSFGSCAGLVAGLLGGWVDAAVMRLVDILLSFPAILIALVLAVTVGPSFGLVVAVLTVYLTPQFARVVRAEAISWKQRDFVIYARTSGVSVTTIALRHLLPNVLNVIIVLATLQLGWVIVAEAGLSFLGAGIPPPTPTWGNMVADGREVLGTSWWLSVLPGSAITIVVLSFNLLGDWLRDRLDPKLRQLIS